MPNPVSFGIAEVMARQARLRAWRAIPVAQQEPIALNAALQIRTRLLRDRINSVIVVSPALRSRRSSLVYRHTLQREGIIVRCVAVGRGSSPGAWTKTWHGVQRALEEFIKLQYYQLYVLPVQARSGE